MWRDARELESELQAELGAGAQDRLVYYAYDLLWRDGDLRKLPQIERKQMLVDLMGRMMSTCRCSAAST